MQGNARTAVRQHARSALRRGVRLIQGFSDEEVRQGADLLLYAYRVGLRDAGLELALSQHKVRVIAGLSGDEEVNLLMRGARSGNPIAALELYYRYGHIVERDKLLFALRNSSGGSAEVREILLKVGAER